MNLINKLPKGLTRAFGKLWLKTQKYSPEICVIGGIACGVGAVVMVGVKTWKNKEQLKADADAIRVYTTKFVPVTEEEEKKLDKKQAKKVVTHSESGEKLLPVPVARNNLTEVQKEQLVARRIDFTKDIFKTYWIPIALEVASGVLIWKGRTILRKDLTKMTAAYAGAMELYRQYRQRTAEKYGKEADEQLALGYKTEEHVDENGNVVERVIKPEANGNLNAYGFWFNDGIFDNEIGEYLWRNDKHAGKSKPELLAIVRQEQDKATYELRAIGYWRLESTMLNLGMPPKEAAKFHNFGRVWHEGEENRVSFGVLDDDDQLEVNKGFTDSFCSQNICYINPNVEGYIGYINDKLEDYDLRYGRNARRDIPYKSFVREANGLIQRYNKEKMEQMIFNGMSDRGQRKLAKIFKR